jgi:hypothetical protein
MGFLSDNPCLYSPGGVCGVAAIRARRSSIQPTRNTPFAATTSTKTQSASAASSSTHRHKLQHTGRPVTSRLANDTRCESSKKVVESSKKVAVEDSREGEPSSSPSSPSSSPVSHTGNSTSTSTTTSVEFLLVNVVESAGQDDKDGSNLVKSMDQELFGRLKCYTAETWLQKQKQQQQKRNNGHDYDDDDDDDDDQQVEVTSELRSAILRYLQVKDRYTALVPLLLKRHVFYKAFVAHQPKQQPQQHDVGGGGGGGGGGVNRDQFLSNRNIDTNANHLFNS